MVASVKSMGSRTNADERASRKAAAPPGPLMKIDIVTGCDSDFAQHLAVMLLSLADTDFGHSFSVFVLWSGTPAEQQKLQEVAAPTPVRVHFIEIKRETLADLVLRPNFFGMIYARLLMSDLLQRELDKILYLDSDILVHGDIDKLWATDLSGKTAGAVVDLPQYRYNRLLGLSDNALFSTRVCCWSIFGDGARCAWGSMLWHSHAAIRTVRGGRINARSISYCETTGSPSIDLGIF